MGHWRIFPSCQAANIKTTWNCQLWRDSNSRNKFWSSRNKTSNLVAAFVSRAFFWREHFPGHRKVWFRISNRGPSFEVLAKSKFWLRIELLRKTFATLASCDILGPVLCDQSPATLVVKNCQNQPIVRHFWPMGSRNFQSNGFLSFEIHNLFIFYFFGNGTGQEKNSY